MMRADQEDFIDQLASLANIDSVEIVREALDGLRIEDLAEGLMRLDTEDALHILQKLEAATAADVLVELPTETARRLISELPDATIAHYLDILPMDDALDLREELEPERFEALLEVIPRQDALEIKRLLNYPEDSAGRLMTERFFEVTPEMTMADILSDIRRASDEKYETVNDLYVLDSDRHVIGVLSLRRAIRAHPSARAREVMNDDVVVCEATDSAEEAARQMARYGFYALPVVDQDGRMVGLFTGDDAQTVLREAETEDVLKLGAVSGDAESYLSLNVWQLAKRRLPWLFFLFVAETFTGEVLRIYVRTEASAESGVGELAVIAKLLLYVPLLIGAGGNAGSQVTTTITRALALGEIRTGDWWLVWRRELAVALLIGLVLGLVGFGRALLGWRAGPEISLVVGMALPCIVIWAATVGSVLPLAAKRVGLDPAVMSAPFITTFVDATGLIIFFEIARRVLGLTFGQ